MTQSVDHQPLTRPSGTDVDFSAVKTRQQAMWASGDFALIGTTLQIVGESLCEAVDLQAGSSVLDVACGNGNATLAAARRFCSVTGLDYVPALLQRAHERADAERLEVRLVEGDAEQLPFGDSSFDVVLSTYGVMFAPDHARAARELVRVCKPGGKIGLANWTPDGFIGRLLSTVGRYVPPPKGVQSPGLWGSEQHLNELFAGRVHSISIQKKPFNFRYTSAEHFIDVFRTYYGPTFKAFGALDSEKQAALAGDIAKLIRDYNRSNSTCVVPAEYAEIVIETKASR